MEPKELVKKWKGNARYTLKFVEAMPDTHFGWKPATGAKTYQAQLAHITTWLRTHSRFVTGIEMKKRSVKNKEEVRAALEEFFHDLISFLESATQDDIDEIVDVWYGKSKKYQVANVMDNHLSHHRGQMVVYLRMAGGKPPSYLGW